MSNIEKLNNKKVGDTVYLLADEVNMRRLYRGEPLEKKIKQTTVTKIGRKYMVVDDNFKGIKFNKTDNYEEVNGYSPDYSLFADKQEIYVRTINGSLMVKL